MNLIESRALKSALSGNFPVLLGATVVIGAMVVTINRLMWSWLCTLASTRFKLEFK
jgi:ABC-type anion transport system duplicated permease subunit